MSQKIKTFWWRHGQTDWNAARKWQGHTDIPLNTVGQQQAQKLAHFMQDFPLDCVFSSDLLRAKKTAECVAELHQAEVIERSELREGNYGRAEGLNIDEIRRKFGVALLEQWRSTDENTLDLRFAGGETKREIVERVMSCIEMELQAAPFQHVGISTHGGVLRKIIQKIDPSIKLPSPVPNCAMFEIDFYTNDQKWEFVTWRDTQN